MDQHVLKFVHGTSELSSTQPQPQSKQSEDYVFNYASSVIGPGLMARNFQDASREGDGLPARKNSNHQLAVG